MPIADQCGLDVRFRMLAKTEGEEKRGIEMREGKEIERLAVAARWFSRPPGIRSPLQEGEGGGREMEGKATGRLLEGHWVAVGRRKSTL